MGKNIFFELPIGIGVGEYNKYYWIINLRKKYMG